MKLLWGFPSQEVDERTQVIGSMHNITMQEYLRRCHPDILIAPNVLFHMVAWHDILLPF